MTAAALVLLALAVLVWPAAAAPGRLRALRAATPGRGRSSRRPPPVVLAGAGAVLATVLAGPGGAVAALVVGAVLLRARRARRREADAAAAVAGLAEGLAAFAAELRSGHPPATAAAAAGTGAHPVCARALALVEATARLGGDVPAALREHAADLPAGPHVRRLADAWSLAERHGIGLASLAAALAEDLRARSRFTGRLAAQLAGPRTTSAVLAGLPLIGLGLGQLMGAHPWAVLTGTALGQVLLVAGALFVAAGLEWSGHLTARVVR